jgi:hypothetical protein
VERDDECTVGRWQESFNTGVHTRSHNLQDSIQYALVDNVQRPFLIQLSQVSYIKDLFLISNSGDIVFSGLKEVDFGTNLNTGPYRDTELAAMFSRATNSSAMIVSTIRFYSPSNEAAIFIAARVNDVSLNGCTLTKTRSNLR